MQPNEIYELKVGEILINTLEIQGQASISLDSRRLKLKLRPGTEMKLERRLGEELRLSLYGISEDLKVFFLVSNIIGKIRKLEEKEKY
jgi:hypothetical protein